MAEVAVGSRVGRRLYRGILFVASSRCNDREWSNLKRSCQSSRAHTVEPTSANMSLSKSPSRKREESQGELGLSCAVHAGEAGLQERQPSAVQ